MDEVGYTYIERQHPVELTKGFWMLETEVTQNMYKSVMGGNNPSYFAETGHGRDLIRNENSKTDDDKFLDTGNYPVDRVAFSDAEDFCKAFSEMTGSAIKLPTEAQWEYACRAGTTTKYYSGDTLARTEANYHLEGKKGNLGRTAPVDSFGKNKWNLRNMMGNVNEWCSDWYDPNYYTLKAKRAELTVKEDENGEPIEAEITEIETITDPTGPKQGVGHVLRGGSWYSQPFYCRCAARNYLETKFHYGHYYDGFRFICIPGEEAAILEKEDEKLTDEGKEAGLQAEVEAEAISEDPKEMTVEEKVDAAEEKVEKVTEEAVEAATEVAVEKAEEKLEEKKLEKEITEEEEKETSETVEEAEEKME